jgi:hypothetical protein
MKAFIYKSVFYEVRVFFPFTRGQTVSEIDFFPE